MLTTEQRAELVEELAAELDSYVAGEFNDALAVKLSQIAIRLLTPPAPAEDAVERVARAIYAEDPLVTGSVAIPWEDLTDNMGTQVREGTMQQARAALSAAGPSVDVDALLDSVAPDCIPDAVTYHHKSQEKLRWGVKIVWGWNTLKYHEYAGSAYGWGPTRTAAIADAVAKAKQVQEEAG